MYIKSCNINVKIVKSISLFKGVSKEISKLYTIESWKKNMYTLFPNSVLVNPASTNKPNLNELYLDKLNNLINSIEPIQDSGSCMGCGKRDAKEMKTR